MSMDLPTSLACFQSYIFFTRFLLVATTRKKKHRKDNSAVHYKKNLFLYMFWHTNVSGAPLHDSWLSHDSHWCHLLRSRGGVWRYVGLEGGGHRLLCEMHICMSVVKYFVYPLLSTDAIQYLKKVLTSTRTSPCRVQPYSCFLAYRLSVGKWLFGLADAGFDSQQSRDFCKGPFCDWQICRARASVLGCCQAGKYSWCSMLFSA